MFVLRAQRTIGTVVNGRYNERSIHPRERCCSIHPARPAGGSGRRLSVMNLDSPVLVARKA
jgi:hypothetical protein